MRKQFLEYCPEEKRKYLIFATYDLAHNTVYGFDIEREETPLIRYYRKEEHLS